MNNNLTDYNQKFCIEYIRCLILYIICYRESGPHKISTNEQQYNENDSGSSLLSDVADLAWAGK